MNDNDDNETEENTLEHWQKHYNDAAEEAGILLDNVLLDVPDEFRNAIARISFAGGVN